MATDTAALTPVIPRPRKAQPPARKLWLIAAIIVGHVVVALLMPSVPYVGIAHAAVCIAVGLFVAARRPLHEVPLVVAYIVSAEVLWRMTRAGLPYEFGKYSISLLLIVASFRLRWRRNPALALGYFGLLLPSALLTIFAFELDEAREQLSFNLSGPFSLTLAILFFSNIKLSAEHVRRTLFALLIPAIGVVAAGASTLAKVTGTVEFSKNSNKLFSGGFGPNQVSATLGLALLACILLLLERKQALHMRILLLLGAVSFATQAALTFSRGGLILALISIIAASVYLLRDNRTRATLMIVSTLLFVVAKLFVVPQLDDFTSGKLAERYSSVDSTGRTTLAGFDLQIFEDNPVLGVGPGVAVQMRAELGHLGTAHTEFTRMLAEHGLLGALALVFLIILTIRTVKTAASVRSRAFVIALILWTFFFLAVNAMRLAAPSFTFGFACAIAYASRARTDAL